MATRPEDASTPAAAAKVRHILGEVTNTYDNFAATPGTKEDVASTLLHAPPNLVAQIAQSLTPLGRQGCGGHRRNGESPDSLGDAFYVDPENREVVGGEKDDISPTGCDSENDRTRDISSGPLGTSFASSDLPSSSELPGGASLSDICDVSPVPPVYPIDDDECSLETSTVVAAADLHESFPSIGSAEHGKGTCRRCNFFPKGRCQNGRDCTFCHFPHDRRKPSRQEKRERLASYREQHVESQIEQTPNGEARDDSDSDEQQQTLAYTVLPGLPPFLATRLPSPLPLPYTFALPSAPPGLPAPPKVSFGALPPPPKSFGIWRPEEEDGQLVVPSSGNLPATVGQTPAAAEQQQRPILATVPTACRSAPRAPAAAPNVPDATKGADERESLKLWQGDCPGSKAAAALKTAVELPQAPAEVPRVRPVMATMGTQTVDVRTVGTQTDREPVFERDALLRLRPRSPQAEGIGCGLITMPVDNVDCIAK